MKWENQIGTGILPPVFCINRRMRAEAFAQRFREGRKVALQVSMYHIQGSSKPEWQPLPENLQHSAMVLELFYYRKDVRLSDDPDALVVKTAETLRRERGKGLQKRCRGACVGYLGYSMYPFLTCLLSSNACPYCAKLCSTLLCKRPARPCCPEAHGIIP